jgi:hypothetical protein
MANNILDTFTKILLNPLLRWSLFITVLILNFIGYIQDPIRLSASKCYFTSCRNFNFIAQIGTFTLDVLTFLSLYLPIKDKFNLPDFWYLPIIILGYAIIAQITIDSKIYEVDDADEFMPPPPSLWPKYRRVILFTAILIIDIIIFIQFFLDSNDKFHGNKVIDFVLLNRFGTFTKDKLSFYMGWLGILGVIADYISLTFNKNYEACLYNHSNSWNF